MLIQLHRLKTDRTLKETVFFNLPHYSFKFSAAGRLMALIISVVSVRNTEKSPGGLCCSAGEHLVLN